MIKVMRKALEVDARQFTRVEIENFDAMLEFAKWVIERGGIASPYDGGVRVEVEDASWRLSEDEWLLYLEGEFCTVTDDMFHRRYDLVDEPKLAIVRMSVSTVPTWDVKADGYVVFDYDGYRLRADMKSTGVMRETAVYENARPGKGFPPFTAYDELQVAINCRLASSDEVRI